MPHRFFTLDVFTRTRLEGNPLAVVLDADDVAPERMQAIAREFALSETVFVLAPRDAAHRARIRIFTTAQELPFAGHPTVGTAVLLGLLDGGGTGPLVLEELVGDVSCVVSADAAVEGGQARFTLPRLPSEIGPAPSDAALAALFGLPVDAVGCGSHRPSVFTAGVDYALIPLGDAAAVAAARPRADLWESTLRPAGAWSAFVYCRETREPGRAFHARMFMTDIGIGEDPATGSAVAAFAGAIVKFDRPADGSHALVIEQGFEMGRPSLIELGLRVVDGELASASVAGGAVVVGEGTLRL